MQPLDLSLARFKIASPFKLGLVQLLDFGVARLQQRLLLRNNRF